MRDTSFLQAPGECRRLARLEWTAVCDVQHHATAQDGLANVWDAYMKQLA